MEYDIMIINAGVRFDYFNSNASLPTDLRNPRHNPLYPGAIEVIRIIPIGQLDFRNEKSGC